MTLNVALSVPLQTPLKGITTGRAFVAALAAGLHVEVQSSGGAATSALQMGERGIVADVVTDTLPGTASFGLDKGGLRAGMDYGGMSLRIHSSALPLREAKGSVGRFALRLALPVLGQGPQDFSFVTSLDDLVASDEVWQVLDPGRVLPRDPVSAKVDLGGQLRVDFAGMIAAEEGGMTEVERPRIDSLQINALTLRGLGAALSGAGAFTFDNAGDVPVPAGKGQVTVDGVGGLLDRLVALRLLTVEAARNARLAMAMVFDKVPDQPDRQMSQVEARADGSIYVNGVRMK
jgi:hypothetical protein